MKTFKETSIREFETWSGAKDTQQVIFNANMEEQFDQMIEELYPDGLSETQLNDLLWFDSDWVYETLGIKKEEEKN